MPLRGGHGVILFIALIERRYVLFMEKTSENTVQVWKNKKIKHWMLIAFFLCFYDIVAVNLSYIFGLFIRFDLTFSAIPKEYMLAYVKFAPIYTAFSVVVFFVFKLYNSLWRFASIGELSRIFLASIVTTIFQAVGITLLFMRMPVAYYIVGAGTQFVLITAVRFAYRYITLLRAKQVTNQVAVHNAMVIGAGASGQMILKELTMSERANARPLCIIDDNPNKWGRNIGGVPIVGGRDCIMESVKKYNIDQILFAIPTASPENKRDILNICAGIGRGQMTVADAHVAHHKHTCDLYRELLKDVRGITLHENPSGRFDSNYWLNTIVLDPLLRVKGQENAYQATVQGAVGGAGGVTHAAVNAHTDCEPNANVEAMRVGLDAMGIESRPLWKPMHKQPVYKDCPAYVNGVSESLFKVGLCLPSGPYVTDEDVAYIVDCIKKNICYN